MKLPSGTITHEYLSWFQISVDSNAYRQDINLILSADIGADITNMAEIVDIDGQYRRYSY